MILERGALLNNRYRIVEILGQGGMGSVYRAIDENLGVEVAVKDNLFTTEEYARQFRREAVILANLRHSNLPRVTDHFVITGKGQYLVMDYIEGEDVRQRMERMGALPEEDVIVIGAAVCDALTYLGTRNPPIIHRDIKPGNVKITPQGHIFLVDFGLAKTLQGSQATTTGARAMTPGYSPPEQYGTARTDQRSDIFSLGATLYAALTGATPEDSLARAMEQAELTPLRKHNPRVSKRMATVVEKALEVRPDERYQTAEEFKAALLSASSGARRKNGDYYVAPPPSEERVIASEEALLPADAQERLPRAEVRSPPPSFIGAPANGLAQQPEALRPRKRRRSKGCIWVLVILALLFLGAGAVYQFDPDLPTRAFAAYWPALVGRASTPTSEDISSGILTMPPSPTSTIPVVEANSTSTSTPTFTPTVMPTETAAPTETPTEMPTPQGGGGGQIAYVSDKTGTNQIFVINSDGSGERQITDIIEGACQPDWSPDAKRIIFISPCDSNSDYYPGAALYITNSDGTGLLPLPTLVGGDYDPKWAPDGEHIVFTSLRNSSRPQLYLMDLKDYTATPLSEKYSFDFQPSWSPDGKKIIFVTTRRGRQQVWIMDADGANQQQFSQSQADALNSRPSWSSDGLRIIFTQLFSETGVPRIMLVPYDTEDYAEYRLGQESLPMRDGVFSPDGYWIAYEGWEAGGGHSIYIIAVTGAIRTRVTSEPWLEFDPIWKPVP